MTNFSLPPEDIEYLNVNYPNWKPQFEDSKNGIIICNYLLPKGYNPEKSDLMLLIPDNYPTAKIDMFYFSPDINRIDQANIEALSPETHFQRNWQRWSRHYDWRVGIDNISTHITYICNQLKSEIDKE
ncbi:MAG: hypothetical protein OXJ52_03030 [Oligoflexia bacterium]|nr:hypothetical protein [Oligoflexia bacterium]